MRLNTVLYITIIINIIFGLLLFVIFIINRIIRESINLRRQNAINQLEPLINELIFTEDDDIYSWNQDELRLIDKLKDLIRNNKFYTKVLFDMVLQMHKSLGGNAGIELKQLYYDLNFDKISVEKLKKGPWYVKGKAIIELTQMEVTSAYDLICRFVDHPEEILRIEAQIAAIVLKKFQGLNFLDNTKRPIPEYQQINLLKILSEFEKEDLPDFSKWLESKNDYVIIFAVNMISHFEQISCAPKLIKLLTHKNETVRIAAVKALGNLYFTPASENFIEIYDKETQKVKIAILNALGKISTKNELDFLLRQLEKDDYEISIEAAKSIQSIQRNGVNTLESIYDKSNDSIKAIIKHTLDKRIS